MKKTKPGPHMGHAAYKAHKAAMRKRSTWMPQLQEHQRIVGWMKVRGQFH